MHRRAFVLGSLLAAASPVAAETEEKPLDFKSGGRQIAVEWFAPIGVKEGEKAPAVLLLHGAEGLILANGYRAAAHLLAAKGIGVAFVHYFNSTGQKTAEIDGMKRHFPAWARAVRDGLSWLGEQPGIDPQRLGIVGISLGAALALYVASHGESRIKAIVDFFGPVSAGVLPKDPKLPPVLILHGTKDEIVPLVHPRTLEAWLKKAGTPYEIKIYPGQGHGFTVLVQQDAGRRAAAFLAKHLDPAPPLN